MRSMVGRVVAALPRILPQKRLDLEAPEIGQSVTQLFVLPVPPREVHQPLRHRIGEALPDGPRGHADGLMQYAEGRMKKKVMGAVEAIEGGVKKVIFADGRIEQPIARAIAGGGTHIS